MTVSHEKFAKLCDEVVTVVIQIFLAILLMLRQIVYQFYNTRVKIADYLNTSTDYLLGRIEDDSPLSGYNIKSMNPKTYKMLNNFLMLKEKEKDECLWYSEAIRKRDFDK